MKQHHFKITCKNPILNGTKVSAKADDEQKARIKVVDAMRNATQEFGLESLVLLGTGKLTPAQMLGAAGGKKSRRSISPEDQKKMQEARRRNTPVDCCACGRAPMFADVPNRDDVVQMYHLCEKGFDYQFGDFGEKSELIKAWNSQQNAGGMARQLAAQDYESPTKQDG